MNTTFIDGTTVVNAAWLNDVNDTVYDILGDGTNPPTDAAALLANLGGATITDVTDAIANSVGVTTQAYSANLDEFAAVNPTAAGLALLDDVDAAAQRTTLGLGTAATSDSSDFLLTAAVGVTVQPYDADTPTVAASQAEMEAGTEAALRSMSPLRIAQAIAALAATGSTSVPVRQTVLSGPVDSNGASAFGGATGSTTVTATGTLKVTSAAGGDLNYTGSIVNPSWTGLSTNGTMYLYVDITSGGVVTTGSTTLAPTYQWGGTYSTTNNQNTFNIQEMTMKVGNGSVATQVYRTFVGQVAVSGSVVTVITWYALMARALVGQTSLATSTAYTLTHNLGVYPLAVSQWLECTTTDNGYAVGDRLFVDSSSRSADTPTAGGTISCNVLTSNLSIGTALGAALAKTSPGLGILLTIGSWKFGASLDRGW